MAATHEPRPAARRGSHRRAQHEGPTVRRLSLQRMLAVFVKEFQQMLRDRMTFAMAVGVPVLQLVLFGYAINTDPKSLPTALVVQDESALTRSLVVALQNTGYFRVTHTGHSEAEAEALIEQGRVQFAVFIPGEFTRRLVRGERPALLVSVDGTDPSASGNAIAALNVLAAQALQNDLRGPLAHLQGGAPPFELRVHLRYNPEGLSRYNIVPGLIGTILTMTLVMLTGLAMTRERERGTMENLLATPARPFEVMSGKILPYIVVGYVQVTLILLAAHFVFHVPMVGSLALLYVTAIAFIAATATRYPWRRASASNSRASSGSCGLSRMAFSKILESKKNRIMPDPVSRV